MVAMAACFETQQPAALRRRLRRGERLFGGGERFASLYTVRYGSFKTILLRQEGREQITGFFMAGDMLGLDGLAAQKHAVDAVAIEDSEVEVMPRAVLDAPGEESARLNGHVNAELSRQIARQHEALMLLGSLSAEQRLAAFLVDLSRRFAARGYSPRDFHLRMTRREIASYLGLQLETVSRLFSEFAERGVIAVKSKHVRIVDPERLENVLKN
jgi:CRP/FNR family transcriptional regulator